MLKSLMKAMKKDDGTEDSGDDCAAKKHVQVGLALALIANSLPDEIIQAIRDFTPTAERNTALLQFLPILKDHLVAYREAGGGGDPEKAGPCRNKTGQALCEPGASFRFAACAMACMEVFHDRDPDDIDLLLRMEFFDEEIVSHVMLMYSVGSALRLDSDDSIAGKTVAGIQAYGKAVALYLSTKDEQALKDAKAAWEAVADEVDMRTDLRLAAPVIVRQLVERSA